MRGVYVFSPAYVVYPCSITPCYELFRVGTEYDLPVKEETAYTIDEWGFLGSNAVDYHETRSIDRLPIEWLYTWDIEAEGEFDMLHFVDNYNEYE